MISAKIIKDSISWVGKRLTTYVLEYPRYIHSELMTHRVFSKNSASSRAITIDKFIKMVEDNPTKPLWTENQKGMQGPVIVDANTIEAADIIWEFARDKSIDSVRYLNELGIHKQNVNRLLEPWMHMRIVLTGTEFTNWFNLRNHKDAQPEIQELARLMQFAMEDSLPDPLEPGDWHIPFGDNIDEVKVFEYLDSGDMMESTDALAKMWTQAKLQISVARCARVSYNNFNGETHDYKGDIELYNKLVVSEPLHASPAEHQARVPKPEELADSEVTWNHSLRISSRNKIWKAEQKVGKYFSNLSGWIQLRKLIEAKEF